MANDLEPVKAVETRRDRFIDLSHTIVGGMVTYKGFPSPLVCDFMSGQASQRFYDEGTSFQIGRIEMVANTGTYLDSPFHRFSEGKDISEPDLANLAGLEGVIVRVEGISERGVDRPAFLPVDARGKAVLVHTGWAEHWGTDRYFEGHPFLTEAAAVYLKEQGAVMVGIDSLNIDNISAGARPVHTTLLGGGYPHRGASLQSRQAAGFRFHVHCGSGEGQGHG
jgi:arylformamidase